jgi:hypothetical protein
MSTKFKKLVARGSRACSQQPCWEARHLTPQTSTPPFQSMKVPAESQETSRVSDLTRSLT